MSEVNDIYTALVVDEGEVLHIYPDPYNYQTIGIGHLLTKENNRLAAISILNKLVGRSTNGYITKNESQQIFMGDVAKFKKQVLQSSVLYPIFDTLDEVRQAGLLNMCFQMGVADVESFHNSLTLVANGSYTQAETNLLKSRWASQTSNRAKRVISTLVTGTFDSYNS